MSSYRIISSDDHVSEPADLWASRIERRFRDRAPHVEGRDDGDWWYCEGYRVLFAPGSQPGKRFEDPQALKVVDDIENTRPGGYIPEEHVKDMDIDGVDVSVLYPTVGLLVYRSVPDGELLTAVCRTYNDWIAEHCKAVPDRLKGVGMLNIDDVRSGIEEMERCAKMGLIGAMITVWPPKERSYSSTEYEPLWAAAQDLGMPLSLHVGTHRATPGLQPEDYDSPGPADFTSFDHWVRLSLGNLIFSGVFERYPKLQVGSVEAESAWVPHFLDRMDYNYTQKPLDNAPYRYREDMLPSDFFHRNVFVGFQEQAVGIRLRDVIGVDNLQWGSDYPHVESTFPRSREILEEILADCTEEEKAKIAGGNAARVYNLG